MDNEPHRPNGSLYRVDGNGAVTRMFGDVIVTNGIAFSPDNRTLNFTDTRRYRTWCFDFDPDEGAISNRRLFADYTASGERPDGACVDVDGGLWTAFFSGGRVVRYRPDGRIDTIIPLPVTNPTCVCFGGSDFATMFVTSARKFLDARQLSAETQAGTSSPFTTSHKAFPNTGSQPIHSLKDRQPVNKRPRVTSSPQIGSIV